MINRKTILSAFICLILAIAFTFGIRYSLAFYQSFQPYYDSKLTSNKSGWMGPKINEYLDLSILDNSKGTSLPSNLKNNLLLLLVIDPSCVVCNNSTDQMREVEKEAQSNSIDFAVASFDPFLKVEDVFKFNDVANLKSDYYSTEGINPNLKLQFPTYFLVNSRGKILRIFLGADPDEKTRMKQAKEIIYYTLQEKESLQ
jgi:hypothetical protein